MTTWREDLLKRLKDPEEAVGYLKACLEEIDMPELFWLAVVDVAEARIIEIRKEKGK